MSIFIYNLILFLNLTVIVAIITLIERKVLALVQRRVGPDYIGYKGRLQFIADALKLLMKHIVIVSKINKLLFISLPACVLCLCYLFWTNLIWGPNLSLFEFEYNMLLMMIFSILLTILLFVIGWISKNKYSILSSNRIIVISLNLEIFLNFIFIYLMIFYETLSFYQSANLQAPFINGFFLCLPIMPLIVMTFLLETSRIPFDLTEAESELIAGHTTEFGGFFFALFYLGEYFHLYCFSVVYILLFFNAWF